MRIISGTARGRKLLPPRNRSIRPTSDRAREALFSILGDIVDGATVLDFYAGTGALGLEALSRGAQTTVFIDKAKESLQTSAHNIQQLIPSFPHDPEIKLIQHDLSRSLPLRELESLKIKKADIIFADPPYSKGLSQIFLDLMDKTNLLDLSGILVIEERVSEKLPEKTDLFSLQEKRTYGEASFWLYRPL